MQNGLIPKLAFDGDEYNPIFLGDPETSPIPTLAVDLLQHALIFSPDRLNYFLLHDLPLPMNIGPEELDPFSIDLPMLNKKDSPVV